jgi:hypothetical protein
MKTAFLVLGAQRSGTSVTSHMLSKFGICFGNPASFLQAAHNPIFFELTWVNQYNDRLIQTLGYSYTDPFLPLESDFETVAITEIANELPALIQQEWQETPTIGIKDPRISLTFPIWRSALLKQGYTLQPILVFRHPAAFLRSNQTLFFNWEGWNEQRHLHFWLRLTLAASYFTRNYPVFYVDYDRLIAHPLEIARNFAACFNLNEKADVAAGVVDPVFHHCKQFTPTGDPLIDHYYRLLVDHQLSAADYLSYRSAVLLNSGR